MTIEQAAYCGHNDCAQAVNEWIDAGRPEHPYERATAGVMTHRGEVLFYARRDYLADGYEAAVASDGPYTDEQRGAYVMRDRAQRARAWHTARRNRPAA